MTAKRTIKDSGETREWETGSMRDSSEGKGKMVQIPFIELGMLQELAKETPIKENLLKDAIETLVIILAAIQDGVRRPNDILPSLLDIIVATGIEANNASSEIENVNELTMFSYGVLEVAKHYEDGAKKYGANNWRKGIPTQVYIDSALRHLYKAQAGMTDEYHLRAASWNLLCYLWTVTNKPNMDDFTK